MSMKDNPGSGYVMAADDAILLLPEDKRAKAKELLEDRDTENLQAFFEKHLPEHIPAPETIFPFGEDDTSDDLQEGGIYACWAESDLFIRTEKPCLAAIREITRSAAGMAKEPELSYWAIWG